jgi:hypothetical protein
MTEQLDPIRKSLLPCTPPPEWDFRSVLGAPHGAMLMPFDTGPVVIRRRVTYGDWEPVRPDRWAPEEPADTAAVLGHADDGEWHDVSDGPVEPDNPAAAALAQHIADHPASVVMAACRLLGWQLNFDLVDATEPTNPNGSSR